MSNGAADTDRSAAPEAQRLRYTWSALRSGRCFSAHWARLLNSGRHIDPYLVWADASGFASFGGLRCDDAVDGGKLPVLVELQQSKPPGKSYALPPELSAPSCVAPAAAQAVAADAAAAAAAFAACASSNSDVDPVFCLLEIPGAYKRDQRELDGRRFSARVLPANLSLLLDCESLQRVQLGVPRIPATAPQAPTGGVPGSKEPDRPRVVIGVIDDGCAFAHPAFCADDGSPRVQFLWDQNPLAVARERPPWHRPDLFGYGAELDHAALRAAAVEGFRRQDGLYAYCALDYAPVTLDLQSHGSSFTQRDGRRLPAEAMRTASHGTSVLFLAAGTPPLQQPVGTPRHPVDAQRALHWQQAAREDHAARWPIIFVQLPTRTMLDTSGGSLGVHVLDGVRYILDRAQRLQYDDKASPADGSADGGQDPAQRFQKNRVIVNISYGAVAGCHDGTSILEMALADLLTDRVSNEYRDCHITVAAGNAHQSRTHARLTLAEGGAVGSLQWTVAPDNPLESYLEIWLPDVDVHNCALPGSTAAQIRVSVLPPGGSALQQLQCGCGWVLHDVAAQAQPGHGADAALPVAGAVFSRAVAQGLRGTMVLLAVARTRAPLTGNGDRWPSAQHGIWQVDVAWLASAGESGSDGSRRIDVHAWAERNDLVWGNLRAQQSTVVAEVPASEPTESTAEARELIAHPRLNRIPGVADPLQPRYSFGTLAGLQMSDDAAGRGRLVVVGGRRLADGEVATYSSGGPYRQYNPVFGGDGAAPPPAVQEIYRQNKSDARSTPDGLQPSDVGVALRGLRVCGTRPGGVARLSGTSAAAPLAARQLANEAFAAIWLPPEATQPDCGPESAPAASLAARPTASPLADDRYRRGPLPGDCGGAERRPGSK